MKITISTVLVLFALLISNTSNAQYRNNRNGMNRGMMNGPAPTPKKAKPIDQVQVSTDRLTTELNLDGFQSAIVKTIMEDYKNVTTALSEEQIPSQLKLEKYKAENEKMENKILEILNDKQKEQFAEFKNVAEKKGKKDKKKKKNKKEEEETTETVEE